MSTVRRPGAARAAWRILSDETLKPVAEDRFRQVLRRARSQQRENTDISTSRLRGLIHQVLRERGFAERLLIREDTRAFFVSVRDISWIEAERNYLAVHCGPKTHTLRATLDSVESTLDPNLFARINRGSLVRLDAIRELVPWFHGEYKVVLHSGMELRWSRRYVSLRPELLKPPRNLGFTGTSPPKFPCRLRTNPAGRSAHSELPTLWPART
jgi:two-component system, LytTR family, response regulator